MKTLSNAELQDAIRYSTECVKNCLQKSNEYQLHLEQLVALLDEQRRRASERVELTLEPMEPVMAGPDKYHISSGNWGGFDEADGRVDFDARVRAQDGPEWVEWNGGECPVPPHHRVDLKFRNKEIEPRLDVPAKNVSWDHVRSMSESDVVKYRDWTAWEQSK